jgi:predicted TIM-barrel fold metal-dependent hydrolase
LSWARRGRGEQRVEVTEGLFTYARVAAPVLLEADGPDRLLWGSDWPHTNTELDRVTTYPKMLQSLAEWVPDAATRRKILQDTPTKLFRFT